MFKSARHALQFAYRTMASPIVKMSSINTMRASSIGGNSGLTPHDRHAQAAMIMAMVERVVDPNGIAYLKARYGGEFTSGPDESRVREQLIRTVTASMPTGVHSIRGVAKLIIIYFGGNISMTSVRIDFKCKNERCYEYRNIAFCTLDNIAVRAEDAVYRALDEAGLIDVEVAA